MQPCHSGGDEAITKSGDGWSVHRAVRSDRRSAAALIGRFVNVSRQRLTISSATGCLPSGSQGVHTVERGPFCTTGHFQLRFWAHIRNQARVKPQHQENEGPSSALGDQRIIFKTLGSVLDTDRKESLPESSVEHGEKCFVFFKLLALGPLLQNAPFIEWTRKVGVKSEISWFFSWCFVGLYFSESLWRDSFTLVLLPVRFHTFQIPTYLSVSLNIVYKQLVTFLNAHGILEPFQSGFISGHHTEMMFC